MQTDWSRIMSQKDLIKISTDLGENTVIIMN